MPEIREILLVPHTHHDIGYTNTPQACLAAHERAIYDVLDLCEADAGSDSPAAFRWTLEISRPLMQFLRHAQPGDVERLQAMVRAGRLAVTGGYMHMTQLIGHESYVRFFEPVRELRERFGLPVSIVQHADVNGLSWGAVPLMRQFGLDCLVMGLNPDHGYPPLEQPSAFQWEGQEGSRVFVWLSSHYGHCDDWGITSGRIEPAIEPISQLVGSTEQRDDYPFDFLLLHSAQDNMWPNAQAGRAVQQWNERAAGPPMRIVTIDAAMQQARAQAASANLPVLRGEWADWWAHGHGSSAYEVGVARQAQADLRVAETLQGLAECARPGAEIPRADVSVIAWYRRPSLQVTDPERERRTDAAYDNLLLFEEHTWGSFDSVTRPHNLFAQAHWNGKAAFAYEAAGEARALSREAAERLVSALPPDEVPALVVMNPLPTKRDEVVYVGTVEGEVPVLVRDIPPLGVKVLPWTGPEPSTQPPPNPLGEPTDDIRFENDHFALEVDPATASISRLYDKRVGREWIDSAAPAGLGAVIYEEVDPQDPHPAVRVDRRNFSPAHPGPRFVRTVASGRGEPYVSRTPHCTMVTLAAEAPYLPLVRTSVTLYDDLPYIDIRVQLDKRENYAMEGVYVAFPFNVANPDFLVETANAVYHAGSEQLPNTCHAWYSVQHAVGITNGDAGILWGTRQAPLVQFGDITTGRWDTSHVPSSGHLYAWLMNNLYFTNFKAAQGGQSTFDFRIGTSTTAVSCADVRAWGEAFAHAPVTLIDRVKSGTYRWVDVQPDNVSVQVLSLASDSYEGMLVRLKETAGKATSVRLTLPGFTRATIGRAGGSGSADGDSQRTLLPEGDVFIFDIGPHQLVSVSAWR
jgi:Glycosyl hydrolases family 38 N-terminal domain